jgi:membrane-associated phospholipid phosphatase
VRHRPRNDHRVDEAPAATHGGPIGNARLAEAIISDFGVSDPGITPQSAALADETWVGSRWLARRISDLCSPPVLAVPVLAIGTIKSGVPGAWRYMAVYGLVSMLVPLFDLSWRRRTGRITDIHLPLRKDRMRSFVVGIAATALGILVLVIAGAPHLMIALGVATLLQATVLFAITLFWQVSVHGAAAGALATFAVLAGGSSMAWVGLLVPLVGWARLHLDRHTLAQVVVGVMIGAASVLVVLGQYF